MVARTARLHPLGLVLVVRRHSHLLGQLTWRETLARYRGSWLGVLWALLDPLLLFLLYLFVFSVVFELRWESESHHRVAYGLNLFAGLTIYNLFSETLNGAPGLILAHRNYVRKAIFPLETLPIARFLSNSIQSSLSLGILLVGAFVVRGRLPWTLVLLPLVLVPLALLTLGLAFFVASLGVFVRDTANLVRLVVTALLFLSPVFYPLSRLPASWRPFLQLNPLSHLIEGFRRLTLEAALPEWRPLAVVWALSTVIVLAGFAWFMKSKKAFADVL